jgi:ribosomal protein L37E
MDSRHMTCKNCGKVGYTCDIGGKRCNNCGTIKKRNRRQKRLNAVTPGFLAWLANQ